MHHFLTIIIHFIRFQMSPTTTVYILDTKLLLVSFYHINYSEYFDLPYSMYRMAVLVGEGKRK